MKVISAVECNVGNVREYNEDNFYFNGAILPEMGNEIPVSHNAVKDDDLQIYAVYDGMGTEEHGENAAFTATKILGKYHRMFAQNMHYDIGKYMDMYLAEVNSRICEMRRGFNDYGIGTAIAMLIVEKDNVHIRSVGDSRIYMFRHNKLQQITEDHTPAYRAYQLGQISKEEMRNHPHRNKLTQYLGIPPEEMNIVPNRILVTPKNNDRFLLCSDGITDMMSDDDIAKVLKTSNTPDAAVKTLVGKARACGGKDNITAMVLDVKLNGKFLWF